jgi:hypothetical protein
MIEGSLSFVPEIDEVIPKDYKIGIYPNPFNPQTCVTFSSMITGLGSIDIYDIQGRHICNVTHGEIAAGVHTKKWNGFNKYGSKVSSGVYFCRMVVNGKTRAVARMTLLK